MASSKLIGLFAFSLCIFTGLNAQQTDTFNYTGAVEIYVVPQCITEIKISAYGAEGQVGGPGGAGGLGGFAEGTMTVTGGDTLRVYVGGSGASGGYNGGGAPGLSGTNISGAGGGASDVRLIGTALTDRVIVAGGGGGGTGDSQAGCSGYAGTGGNGGDLVGIDGTLGGGCGGTGTAGTGGTASTGGLGGTGSSNCAATADSGLDGLLGIGGNGGDGAFCTILTGSGGGGGGGGYYGAGGGGGGAGGSGGSWAGNGGGGGSSFLGALTLSTTTAGLQTGDGVVMITAFIAMTVDLGADTSICEGSTLILDAQNAGATYIWNDASTNQTLTANTAGTYSVEVTGACVLSDTIVVSIIPSSTATVNETGLDSYTWPQNGQTYTQSGNYVDTIVNAAGCDSIITLNLSLQFTGITEFIKQVVSISPNPTTQFVHVVVKESSLGNAYGIVDQQGRTILMGTLTQKDTEIDLSELAEGMYVFVLDGDTRQSFRIVKQ